MALCMWESACMTLCMWVHYMACARLVCLINVRSTLMAHNATVDKAASLCFGMQQLVTKVN